MFARSSRGGDASDCAASGCASRGPTPPSLVSVGPAYPRLRILGFTFARLAVTAHAVFAHGLIVTLGSTPMQVTFTGFTCVMCLFLWRVCFLAVSRVLLLEPPR